MFYKSEKLSLFIDGQALWHASKSLGKYVDYALILKEFSQRGKLVHAYYYSAVDEDNPDNPLRPMLDWLSYNGFVPRTKPIKKREGDNGTVRYKSNMNLEIALDAVDMSNTIEHVVLFTGDGELVPLVHFLQRRGCRVSVVSTMRGEMPSVADDLRRAADNFIELDNIPIFKEARTPMREAG